MTAARPCPGDLLAGLVDGQLDHPARERVQRHLVNCADCRAERAAQADLKAILRRTAIPPVSVELTARLLGLAAPAAATGAGSAEGASPAGGPGQPGPLRGRRSRLRQRAGHPSDRSAPRVARTGGRSLPGGWDGRRPTGPRRLTGRQRLSLSGCLAVLSLSAAFALGAPSGEPPVVRLDPGTDVFVADYAGVTTDVPVIAGVTSVGPPRR